MKLMKLKTNEGFALATTLILLGVVLIAVSGLLAIAKIEARISRSQKESVQAYYIAEAGVQNALWQIRNDTDLQNQLNLGTLDESWQSEDQILNLRDIRVTARSTEPGRAEIIATGLVNEDQYPAQRLVKVQIFRGVTQDQPESILGQLGLYGSSTVTLIGTQELAVNGGDVYGGSYLDLWWAQGAVDGKFKTKGDFINRYGRSNVTNQGVEARNFPPPAQDVPMPGVDFASLRAAANQILTAQEFRDLVRVGGEVHLPGPITFIDGNVTINAGWFMGQNRTMHLIVHGLLVIDGNFHFYIPSVPNAWNLNLKVVDDTNGPSGIISSRNIVFLGRSNPFLIDGVVYATQTLGFADVKNLFINGGVVARDFYDLSGDNVTVNTDQARLGEMFGFVDNGGNEEGRPSTLEVSHWEEEY